MQDAEPELDDIVRFEPLFEVRERLVLPALFGQ